MHLKKVTLNNFRCFRTLEIELHHELTVLVAENGQGKSTVLDAIRIALWPFVSSFDLARNAFNDPGNAITIDDARLVKLGNEDMARQLPCSIALTGDFGTGEERTWTRYRDSEAKLSKTKEAGDTGFMRQWASAVQAQIRDPNKPTLDLPVFGYYGTGRLWSQKRLTETSKGKDDTESTNFYIRTFAYLNCLDPASSFKHFKEWFTLASQVYWESVMKLLELKGTEAEPESAEIPILVVRQAIDTVLKPITGWHTLEYSFKQGKSLVLHHDVFGILKVETLSDGIRSILAMIGDIAYRCFKLNPHLGISASKETQGVVMIDEIDMHLHPAWQQLVLSQLREAFPKVQFIVTTHSPQVLTTVKRENIRIIAQDADGTGSADMPDEETKGVESSTAMNDVMGVNQVPPVPEARWRNDYTALIENGDQDTNEGKELRAKLSTLYGEQHSIILDFDRLIRFQAFKRRKTQPSE